MAKRNRKRNIDVKAAAANDDTAVEITKAPRVTAEEIVAQAPQPATVITKKSATATGAAYHVLTGRPSKQAVIACFGKTGYALSWVARAIRLNVTPEELCTEFKSNPEGLKASWEVANKRSA